MKYRLKVNNTHCDACLKLITKKVGTLTEVESITPDGNEGLFLLEANEHLQKEALNAVLASTDYAINSLEKVE